MTVTVGRHNRPNTLSEAAVQKLTEELAESVRDLEETPGLFGLALNEALMHAQARLILDPKVAELATWRATTTAMQVGSAAFATAATTADIVECRITDRVHTFHATGPQFYANAGNWLTSLWFVIICRDQLRMTQMCEVPLEVLRASGAHGDEYVYHWVDALQTYWLERPGLMDKMSVTIDTSYPEIATTAPRDLLQNVLYPPINLFFHFLRKDHSAFNSALVEALELHKLYWSVNEERSKDFNGAVALGPLAIACLAYDAGFPITVESDYLPKRLLERHWVGSFEI